MTEIDSPLARTTRDFLFKVEAPWIYAGPGEPERLKAVTPYFYARPGLDTFVRLLRGWKMRTLEALMDEFGAALQISAGYTFWGENWNGLVDCLRDMDGWTHASAYVLVVERAEEISHEREHPDTLAALLTTAHDAAEYWSQEVTGHGTYDRPAKPFHMLLNYSDEAWNEAEEERLKRAAVELKGELVPLRLPGGIWTPERPVG